MRFLCSSFKLLPRIWITIAAEAGKAPGPEAKHPANWIGLPKRESIVVSGHVGSDTFRREQIFFLLFPSHQLLEYWLSSWLLVTSITLLLRNVCLQLRDPLFPRERWRLLTLYVTCLPLVLSLLQLAMLTDISIGREVRRWRMYSSRRSIRPTARHNNWGAFLSASPNHRGAQAQG